MIKKMLTVLAMTLCMGGGALAQGVTSSLTAYPHFKSGTIHLSNGKTIKNPLLNVFLKNACLLYRSGANTMEANMDNIKGVDFDDRTYIKIGDKLAHLVDSVKGNRLYCITLIDLAAYQQSLRNDVNITNLDISSLDLSGGQLSYTTVDLAPQEGLELPVVCEYYYLLDGKMVRVHERDLSRALSKERRRLMRTIMTTNDFSWVSEEQLMKLLKAITE